MLALAIRDNSKIKGITVNGVTKKLNFLADDGLIALKWLASSFQALVTVLDEFSLISNLIVNKHKSMVVKIGPNKTKVKKFKAMQDFPYNMGKPFRYLGIDWILGADGSEAL